MSENKPSNNSNLSLLQELSTEEKFLEALQKEGGVDFETLAKTLAIKRGLFQKFKHTAKSVGWLVGLSFVIGIGIAFLSVYLPDPEIYKATDRNAYKIFSLLQLIVKDIGLGLIVSGIAIFGFEWLSHLNKTLERSDLLAASIFEIASLKNSLRAVEDLRGDLKKIKEDADRFSVEILKNSKHSYPLVLEGLFSNSDSELRFKEKISEIIKHATELKKGGSDFSATYLDFLAWHFDRLVTHTRMLSSVNNKNVGARFDYIPPNGKDVVSRLLGCHIRSLKAGDEYATASNPKFWLDDKLNFFMEETEKALKNNVKVSRLFNLSNYETAQDIQDIGINNAIKFHTELSDKYPNYNIAFMFKPNLEDAKNKLKGNITEKKFRKLDTFYFGLFKQEEHGKNQIITLEAIGDEMSEMNLTYDGDNSENYKIFQKMWELSEKVSE